MKIIFLALIALTLISCQTEIEKYGQQYQEQGDFKNLQKVMNLLDNDLDTAYIKKILGEPIDMGFDYRYLTEKSGENGCVIGAVFHIDEAGKIDDKWIGEICE